ncbi:MAG: carbamoyl-phosphate synthase small subunit [Legionella sp.]|nr:MAG: carbamoyl-phosphate synthase small subunit [Legionella sp.]PJD99621.1 MAG: carbamoyl-phosphate synthase small subunit [Legionella sp.]
MNTKPAVLALADGSVYEGISIGAQGTCVGELVFNTSMTGYQEMLTDPSYARQIIMLTNAHIGNTGCVGEDLESHTVWASGLVIRDYSLIHSNYRANVSLGDWLKNHNTVAIAGLDTRAITLKLRDQGAMGACISTEVDDLEKITTQAKAFQGLKKQDLALEVSRQMTECWYEGRGEWSSSSLPSLFHVVVYDFGVKHNILRILYDKGCHITVVPAKTPAADILAIAPDGVFLSNGPGDPEACTYAIDATRELLEHNIPLLGICLGFQILALACGGHTKKMKFGHHGSNHPVIETEGKKRVFITSQNHGFEVDEDCLPASLIITHRSLFDNSVQGIKHRDKPAMGFQGHPEASPGPHDIEILFDEFVTLMKTRTKNSG